MDPQPALLQGLTGRDFSAKNQAHRFDVVRTQMVHEYLGKGEGERCHPEEPGQGQPWQGWLHHPWTGPGCDRGVFAMLRSVGAAPDRYTLAGLPVCLWLRGVQVVLLRSPCRFGGRGSFL